MPGDATIVPSGARAEGEPARPDPLVGTLLDGKYRVDRAVAEGGFGIVYEGHHIALDAKVAIKVLKAEHARDDDAWGEALARFLDEARTLAKLRHPSVVAVLDTGITHIEGASMGVPWMVLEWLEGQTLHDDLAM